MLQVGGAAGGGCPCCLHRASQTDKAPTAAAGCLAEAVLCAAAFCMVAVWVDANQLLPQEQVAAASRLLPHFRFAHMRPHNAATYWHAFSWFR